MEHLRSFTGGDPKTEGALIDIFIEQSDLNYVEMIEQCSDGENIQWTEITHMFKSGAGAVGAMHLAELCYHAQMQRDVPIAERKELLDRTKFEYLAVKEYLRGLMQKGQQG